MDNAQRTVRWTLSNSLNSCVKLPFAAMRECGPAAQTLAAICNETSTSTFKRMSLIASSARVPLKTARNHLETLVENGWLTNEGRGHTANGQPRRTNTISLTPKAKAAFGKGTKARKAQPAPATTESATEVDTHYGLLPWWACCHINGIGSLSWCEKAVLSIVMARLAMLKFAYLNANGEVGTNWLLERLNDRFGFSIEDIMKATGLSRSSVIAAKRELKRMQIIESWCTNDGISEAVLISDPRFGVIATPTSPGNCRLHSQQANDLKLAIEEAISGWNLELKSRGSKSGK